MMLTSSNIKTSNSPGHPLSPLPPPGPPPTDALPGLPPQSFSIPSLDSPSSSPVLPGSTTSSTSSSPLSSNQSSFVPFHLTDRDRASDVPPVASRTDDPSSRRYLQPQERSFNSHRQRSPALAPSSSVQPLRLQTASSAPSRDSLLPYAQPLPSPPSQGYSFSGRPSVGMPRTPSRLLLQQALDLAQIAVGLDQAQDFHEAVIRYQETVSMLRIVMARIESRGNQSKAGIGDNRDDQGLTLKGIHDAYLSRISMLQEQLYPPDASSLSNNTSESDHHQPRMDHTPSPTRVRSVSPTNSRSTSSSSEPAVPPMMTTFHRPRRLSHTTTEVEPSFTARTADSSDASYLGRSASTTSSHRSSYHSRTQSLQNRSVSPSIHTEFSTAQTSSDGSDDRPRVIPAPNADLQPSVYGTSPSSFNPSTKSLGDEPDRLAFQRRQSLIESLGLFSDENAGKEETTVTKSTTPITTATKPRRHVLEDVQESPRSIAKELETDIEPELSITNDKTLSERSAEQGSGFTLSQEVQYETNRVPSHSSQRPSTVDTASSEIYNSSVPSLPPIPSIARKESFPSVQYNTTQNQSPNQLSGSFSNGRSVSGHSSLYPSMPPSVSTIEGSPSLLSTSPPSNGDDRKLSHQSSDRFSASPPLVRTVSDTTSLLPASNAQYEGGPRSTPPECVPTELLHRPFHLMRALRLTMVSPGGGYLTPRLHVPSGAWSQSGVFLQAVDTKVQVIHVLIDYLQALEKISMPLVSMNTSIDKGSYNKTKLLAAGVEFLSLLDSWENVMETVQTTLAKKNIVQHSKKGKSGGSNWGFKISRGLDRLANGKNIDTLQAYSSSLKRLFAQAQFLDTHLRIFNSGEPPSPNAPHMSLPQASRVQIEARLKRTSEFFGQVIIAFVLKDLMSLLDKYTKNVEKWILE